MKTVGDRPVGYPAFVTKHGVSWLKSKLVWTTFRWLTLMSDNT